MEKNSNPLFQVENQTYYLKCDKCGEKGSHVCIPEVCDMLLKSDDFKNLIRVTLQEEIEKLADMGKLPEYRGSYYGKGPIC